ncbi:MAG TPA: Gfo/Idh/MocA family oxidoreductase [Bryobacteraceae bacterium]|nr:Gfo/Idh/MocA family oxidoreductase [Bryobacteraceae bacterium]
MSLRVGVLGLGFMGSTHVGAWQKVPQASLVAVCSSVEAKLQGDLRGISGNVAGASERHDFSHLKKYSRIDQLLSDPDIDAVDICLPTYLHADVARCALEAGKHVLVEKPLAISATAAAELLDVYRRSGRILMAAQVVRFFPQYGRLHDLLLSGRLGAVRSATLRRRCAAPTWSEWLHAVE